MKASMRLPKLRGFHNRFRKDYVVVNLSKLNRFAKDSIVDGAALAEAGLVSGVDKPVKLLAAGRVKVAVRVRVHRASAAAQRRDTDSDVAAAEAVAESAAAADAETHATETDTEEEPQA